MTNVSNKMYVEMVALRSEKNNLNSEILIGCNQDLNSEIFISPLKHNKMYVETTCIEPEIHTIICDTVQDSYIKESSPTMNYCSSHTLYIGDTISKGSFKSFIQFNIPKLESKYKIKYASLCFSTVEINKPMKFKMSSISTEWKDNNITWRKYPSKGNLEYTSQLISTENNIEIDATQYIREFQNQNYKDYGIMLETITDEGLCGIYSKESISPPYIKIFYYDSTERNINIFELASEVCISNNTDLDSEIIVKSTDGLSNDLKCEIQITNPNLNCEIEILPLENLLSEIVVNHRELKEVDCEIFISNPNLHSEIIIPYKNELESEINVIQYTRLESEIMVFKNGENRLETELIVSKKEDLESEIDIICRKELYCSLIIGEKNDLDCEINVNSTTVLDCEIIVTNPIISCEILIPYKSELESEISIPYKSELESEILLWDNNSVNTEILISKKTDVNCEIFIPVLYSSDINCEINILASNDLENEITVNSPAELNCEILIPYSNDLDSEIIILERAINELISVITVSNDILKCEIFVEENKNNNNKNYVYFM